ncbi:glutamine synthetase family protein [Candidatus Aciduliprofundum boonei]|uniref:Glutamate--ammonia ligase n=1 Tax=Aciduliprofundum boonei (strain DSM 19572 / T469) TaxID=439481 RepID=B5ID07_ACIB4|nr:glutamine synthetase beta-grasp domain-containing protein [Candidatus Aciduliprofundum boonei]ADD09230.1 Glutamate--ammonia ligase [Aciduliprofundum boonei T469]EDY35807.1 glutamine synthetase, catalytic domain, putative [Aciduliprofundum boonei T469]HII55806.1 glutamine synthetase [Candidatus Aciduliprofundum boonei]
MTEWVYANLTDIMGKVHTIALRKDYESFFKNGIGIDGSSIPGFASVNRSDLVAKPDMRTFVKIPWRHDEYLVLLKTYYEDNAFDKDPKNVAEKADLALKEMGYEAVLRPELEFFVLNENGRGNTHYFEPPYSDVTFEYRKKVSEAVQDMGIPIRYHHHENASGQIEVELLWIDGVELTCDYTIYTKIVSKWLAKDMGMAVTYMPKLKKDMAGNGMHIHMFLKKNGENIFRGDNEISQEARYFIGGILEHMPYITALTNPTINSYKRLNGGLEAPRYLAWGYRNRSTLIRVPARMKDIEVRNADSSANPYLAFSLIILAGLDGIKKKIEPSEPVDYDLYALSKEKLKEYPALPESLEDAIELMESDEFVKYALGNELYDTFIDMKKLEIEEFLQAITDWEIKKYRDI